jgi:DNA-binding NarL/FixJ family response regulator
MTSGRIFIVEDEWIVARDVERVLKQMSCTVVGTAHDAAGALRGVAETRPDLVTMDIRLQGGTDGTEVAREIWQRFHVPVVFLTAFSSPEVVRNAIQPGTFAYVLKPFDERQLQCAVAVALHRSRVEKAFRAGAERERLLRDGLKRVIGLLSELSLATGQEAAEGKGPVRSGIGEAVASLSAREREVLRLFLSNYRVASIARTLFISPHTVRNHLKAIFRKFGVRSQVELLDVLRNGPAEDRGGQPMA